MPMMIREAENFFLHIQNTGHIYKEALICCMEKKLMELVSKRIIDYLLP